MLQPDPDPEELSPGLAREQLTLYAENFHRFVLEAIPRLEQSFNQQTMEEMLILAKHYQQAFSLYTRKDDLLATHYLLTASRLVETISHLLGKK